MEFPLLRIRKSWNKLILINNEINYDTAGYIDVVIDSCLSRKLFNHEDWKFQCLGKDCTFPSKLVDIGNRCSS